MNERAVLTALKLTVILLAGVIVFGLVRQPTPAPASPDPPVDTVDEPDSPPPRRPAPRGPAREDILQRIARSRTFLDTQLLQRDSALKHWPERIEHPVNVMVMRGTGAPGFDDRMLDAARGAFLRWERVAGIPVRFSFVRDSSIAEVIVVWTERFDESRGRAVVQAGSEGWIRQAVLTLATRHPKGHQLSQQEVYEVALHETGHLLGLAHSDSADDLMYGKRRVTDISARDEATARLLYALPPGSLRSR
jgi:hypothetical protein